MNFTNSPYERMMKEIPPSRSIRPAEGTGRNALCGVFLLAGNYVCFLLSGTPRKTGLMCKHFARKNALFARVSSLDL